MNIEKTEQEEQKISNLIENLKLADVDIRRNAIVELGNYGKRATRATFSLLQAFRDSDTEVSSKAVTALSKVGKESGDVLLFLREAIGREKDSKIKEKIEECLHLIQNGGKVQNKISFQFRIGLKAKLLCCLTIFCLVAFLYCFNSSADGEVGVLESLGILSEKCPVHGTSLKIDEVEIIYGKIGFMGPDNYFSTREARFPYANNVAFGGCVDHGDKKTIKVKFCKTCRKEKASFWESY